MMMILLRSMLRATSTAVPASPRVTAILSHRVFFLLPVSWIETKQNVYVDAAAFKIAYVLTPT